MIISKFRNLFLKLGLNLNKATKSIDLDLFFRQIKPVRTNFELIRIGGNGDSGYLIPNDLDGIKYCFSPGVSVESYFEDELSKYNITSYLADYSVEAPSIKNDFIKFEKKYVGIKNTEICITLEDWVNRNIPKLDCEMILQMDIEGSEYEVIIDTANDLLRKFRIIVIEFHGFDRIFNPIGFQLISNCIYKLLKNFDIVHIHPNNIQKLVKYKNFEVPPLLEFTFIRKDRVIFSEPETSFPHFLDRPNVISIPDIILPKNFIG
jgi:hypothetical protein